MTQTLQKHEYPYVFFPPERYSEEEAKETLWEVYLWSIGDIPNHPMPTSNSILNIFDLNSFPILIDRVWERDDIEYGMFDREQLRNAWEKGELAYENEIHSLEDMHHYNGGSLFDPTLKKLLEHDMRIAMQKMNLAYVDEDEHHLTRHAVKGVW